MRLFLLIFFLLYGAFHLYAFLKARSALAFNPFTGAMLALFMAIMILAPFIIRLSEKSGLEFFARLMSYIGYTWLGLLFLFISISLCIDLYRLIIYFAGFVLKKDFSFINVPIRYAFFIPLGISIIIALYGYFEAKNIRTEKLTIETPKISKEIGSLKIVQISDVHLGLIVREKRLKRIIAEVKKAVPDILISTGDLVDGQINELTGLAKLLGEINPKYGKFAVTGNHEFYAGLEQSLRLTEKAGFRILRGEGLTVAGINIIGIDDPAVEYYGLAKRISEKELLLKFDQKNFTLFLKHRPLLDKNSIGLFDLQVSGHIHRGQIFPFSIITALYYPVNSGVINLPNNAFFYVSRGSGTWGPPIRFLAPPEVTLIELIHRE